MSNRDDHRRVLTVIRSWPAKKWARLVDSVPCPYCRVEQGPCITVRGRGKGTFAPTHVPRSSAAFYEAARLLDAGKDIETLLKSPLPRVAPLKLYLVEDPNPDYGGFEKLIVRALDLDEARSLALRGEDRPVNITEIGTAHRYDTESKVLCVDFGSVT